MVDVGSDQPFLRFELFKPPAGFTQHDQIHTAVRLLIFLATIQSHNRHQSSIAKDYRSRVYGSPDTFFNVCSQLDFTTYDYYSNEPWERRLGEQEATICESL